MSYPYPDPLTQEQRIDLKEKLQLIAEWYFTEEKPVQTSCGICNALSTTFDDSSYYEKMESLLWELYGDLHLASYTDSYEEWEDRAYMCLFLVEYLDTTIDLKSSEILRKASVLLVDSLYDYDIDDWSCYICDCIRIIERDIGSTVSTMAKGRQLRQHISEMLGGDFSLGNWLVNNGHATLQEIRDHPQKMQQTRYNMLSSMIEYYESKGD
jgi:hypothetical protein